MMDFIHNFFRQFIDLSLEMSPYLMAGFIFAGVLHVFFPKNKIAKYLGKSNFRSVLNSSLIGIPLPLCSCGVIPAGISFYKNGASKGSSVSFLISTPQTGIDSFFATYSLLGLPMAIARPFIALFTGVMGGMLTNVVEKNGKGKELHSDKIAEEIRNEMRSVYKNPLVEMFRYAFVEFLSDIAKWLLIGLLLAALLAVLVPDDFITRYTNNEFLNMLMSLLVAGPLYVCATGSIPIAAVLMMKGITPGAAIVFLMAGPATNAATITVIAKVLGKRTLLSYLASIIGGALLFGLGIDYLLPREWFTYAIHNIHHGAHVHNLLPLWLKYLSAITLAIFVSYALVRKYILDPIKFKNEPRKAVTMKQIIVKVEGMTCNHCKMSIEGKIASIQGVKEVKVDLASSMVKITGEDIDLAIVKNGVESIGYKYAGQVG